MSGVPLPDIIPEEIRKKLEAKGITTIDKLALMTPDQLAQTIKVPRSKAEKILAKTLEYIGLTFKTAYDLSKEMSTVRRITTGSKALDELLGGGVETRAITEFFGKFGSGKSQLCHQLAVNVQLPEDKGGLEAKAVYIDTEGTFRWERIEQMARGVGLDPKEAMKNIYWVRPINVHHQLKIVEELPELIEKEGIGLVVVDSVTALFRAEFPGRENLARRQQLLNEHLNRLKTIAHIYNVAVVVTNQVMAKPDVFFGDPTAAIGGNIMGHAPLVRVYLIRRKGNKRIARVIDAPHLPEAEAEFMITEEGIRDVED